MKRAITQDESLKKAIEFNEKWNSLRHPRGISPSFETSSKEKQS